MFTCRARARVVAARRECGRFNHKWLSSSGQRPRPCRRGQTLPRGRHDTAWGAFPVTVCLPVRAAAPRATGERLPPGALRPQTLKTHFGAPLKSSQRKGQSDAFNTSLKNAKRSYRWFSGVREGHREAQTLESESFWGPRRRDAVGG